MHLCVCLYQPCARPPNTAYFEILAAFDWLLPTCSWFQPVLYVPWTKYILQIPLLHTSVAIHHSLTQQIIARQPMI